MLLPTWVETTNVIDVDVDFFNVPEDIFHDFLCKIGGLLDSHRESPISILAEGCVDHTQVFAVVVKLKAVVLHRKVQLGEKLVPGSLVQDVIDLGQRVDLALDQFVERSKIRNPSYSTILLGCHKRWGRPFTGSPWFKDSNRAESVQFVLEDLFMVVCNRIRSKVHGFCILLKFQMELASGVVSQCSVKQLGELLQ